MVAASTLPQSSRPRKSPIGKSGVLVLSGFGIKVRMQCGHLEIEDGIGPERRKLRLARIGHGLKRLVVIGSDGFVSLAALRWLADQDASFSMLESDGSVLAASGPVRSSDAKLRRAQALAEHSGAALRITRELISRKLAGQEQVARHTLLDSTTADAIARFRAEVPTSDCIGTVRLIESQAARAYWSMWSTLPITFPKNDLKRIPERWSSFGTRVSPLTGSPRHAVNPANAILNYLYCILESEARLAAAALGLDPGLGVMHVDTPARDSLACDLMEAARAEVDAYVLDWVTRQPLRREWFVEQRDGNCRLTAALAVRLAETAPLWGRAVAGTAEWVAQQLWSTTRKRTQADFPPTHLTQTHRREAKRMSPETIRLVVPQVDNLCPGCGKRILDRSASCVRCGLGDATKNMLNAARIGRRTANGPEARAKHAITARKNAFAQHSWKPSDQPPWLTPELFTQQIQPLLANIPTTVIRSSMGVSKCYASKIRHGYRPHPRHWQALAGLAGVCKSRVDTSRPHP